VVELAEYLCGAEAGDTGADDSDLHRPAFGSHTHTIAM
jgi:hypothetical protein